MADRIIEEHVHTDGGGSMGLLAVVLILIVLLAVLYFTGVFGNIFGKKETKIDVDVNTPKATEPAPTKPNFILPFN